MTQLSKLSKKYTVVGRNLKKIMSDPERKSLPRMSGEFVKCCLAKRCFAAHYLTSFLYRKDISNILDYVSLKEAKWIQDRINDRRLAGLLSNKLIFSEHLERGGFPVPPLLAYNTLDRMHLKSADRWETVALSSAQSMKDALCRLVDERNIQDVFLKPIVGTQGQGAFKIAPGTLHDPERMNVLFSAIVNNNYIFQQVVAQHPDMSLLNPSSLNTMRIDTFRAPGEKAEILSALLRIGGAHNDVDNVSAGGLLVGIHLDTGTLKEKAMNLFHGSKSLGTFRQNPTTGLPFDRFKIPLFEKVKQTLIEAAEWIPSALVGWDIAVGTTGPVLIEANVLYYGLEGSDIAYGGYGKNPVYQKALEYARERGH